MQAELQELVWDSFRDQAPELVGYRLTGNDLDLHSLGPLSRPGQPAADDVMLAILSSRPVYACYFNASMKKTKKSVVDLGGFTAQINNKYS